MTLSRDTGLRVKLRRGALGGAANQNATLSVVSFGAGDPARFARSVADAYSLKVRMAADGAAELVAR